MSVCIAHASTWKHIINVKQSVLSCICITKANETLWDYDFRVSPILFSGNPNVWCHALKQALIIFVNNCIQTLYI